MKKKMLLTLSLLLVFSLGLTSVAVAEELEGTGWVWAKGAGYAEVHGDGRVDIQGHGVGTVRIKGAEVLRAQGHGRRWDLPDGTVLFAGWRGHIHAAGHDLDVNMIGGLIEFTARGRGWVLLKGRGVYRANGRLGRWTTEGVRIELQPEGEAK